MSAAKGISNRSRGLRKRIVSRWQLYLMLLLPVTYIFIFAYIPMYGAQIAFRDFNFSLGIWASPWVGLKHFIRFTTSYLFERLIRNVITINLYSLAVGLPIPLILALMIHNVEHHAFKKSVQMITYAPYFISVTVLVGMLIQFLNVRVGFVNKLIELLGMKPISFMGESRLFSSVYVWSGIWQSAGWGTIVYIAALSNVDVSTQEAAIIDGANKLQRNWYIDLPSIIPTFVIILILSSGSIMNVGFEKIFLMQNDLNIDRSEVIQTYLYKIGVAAQMPNYSYATAIGLFNSVINFVVVILVNRIAKKLSDTSLW